MRHISYFLAAALPAFAQAAAPYQFDMTGDQFVAALEGRPTTEQDFRARERAYSYLDGVKDATVGTAWCPTRPRKTHELAFDAADYMKTLHADLRGGNAAKLLLAYLAHQYPCKGAKQ